MTSEPISGVIPKQEGVKDAKDPWDKADIVIKILCALIGLIISYLLLRNQQENSASASKISQAQIQASLIGPLTQGNESQRKLALEIALKLDREFAGRAAEGFISANDTSEQVRAVSIRILTDESIKERLEAMGLIRKLDAANAIVDSKNVERFQEAVEAYMEISKELYRDNTLGINQVLLGEAVLEAKAGRVDLAAKKFRSVFQFD
jgi:hypothetical protein